MKLTLNRLAWVRARDLTTRLIEKIREDLTVTIENEYGPKGTVSHVKYYEESRDVLKEKWFGVPRQYVYDTFDGFTIKDQTTYSHLEGPWARPPKFTGLLRPGQMDADEAVIQAFRSGQNGGWIKAACGTGKTVTALHLIARMKTPTIVLVHKTDLMNQWEDRIKQFLPGANVVKVRANEPCIRNAHIVIATFQTLYSRMDSFRKAGFFDHFGFLVSDESHRVPAQTFASVLNCFSARYRLGLTATPKRRDGLECLLNWSVGPQLCTMTGKTLSGSYYVCEWEWDWKKHKMPRMRGGALNTARFISMAAENPQRNKAIANMLLKGVRAGRKVLALTDRVSQLDELELLLENLDGVVKFRSPDDMEEAASDDCRVVLATYGMFGEGTDIPALDTLVLCTPRSRIEQMVGRIQRLHAGKKTPFVVDIVDKLPYGFALFRSRVKVYESLDFNRQRAKRKT